MTVEDERSVAAGPITFVVQHRVIVQEGATMGGPTVRVVGGADGHEYLKFDMFDVSPHYHYSPPTEEERIHMLDTVADGDAISWTITRLRDRLAPMLTAAGGQALADALDDGTIAHAIDDVESFVRNP